MESILVSIYVGSKFCLSIRKGQRSVRILRILSGPKEALKEVNGFQGACYKCFGTRELAEAFIEDWKEAYAEGWWREVRVALDQGHRSHRMKLDFRGILRGANQDVELEEFSKRFDSATNLSKA
jgi:viroplasmin and RNaseH domain-containing protein